jgi:hypothetical protein
VWIAINHIIRPPGWLPDGNGETTEDMLRRAGLTQNAKQAVPRDVPVKA